MTSDFLKKSLEKNNFIVPSNYDDEAELNICVGGDGAFLRAVHKYQFTNIPFIGVNTGHLGFFQEIQPDDIDDFIKSYLKKEYSLEKVFLVSAKVHTKKDCFELFGVNEIVIKGIDSRVVHLNVYIDDNHLQNFSGDGLIISTPVGSTAYNMSSGGSVVYPSLKILQMTPLSPINSKAYRSLANSAIVPGDIKIRIEPEYRYENSILVVVDGIQHKYSDITKIEFSIPEKTISRVNLNKDIYWTNLKSKFL